MAERSVIWDPLRKKDVARTPEETVRQWFINILHSNFQVPLHMMMSEAGLKLGEKQYRADILVYDRKTQPLVIVECKRPAWFKFSSGNSGMLGVYTGTYVMFPSDVNYATGETAPSEPIEIRDVEE